MTRIAAEIGIGIALTVIWYFGIGSVFRQYPDTPFKVALTYIAIALFFAFAVRLGRTASGSKNKER